MRRRFCYNKRKLMESIKVKRMKRILALTLSLLMLLTVAVGCNEEAPEKLTNNRISTDLAKNHGLYAYSHVGGTPDISQLKIVEKKEEGEYAYVTASAVATFDNAVIRFTAEMEYQRVDRRWRLNKMTVPEKEITSTGAPRLDSVLVELSNYVSLNNAALAVKGEDYHTLTFNPKAANWDMQHEEGAKTATLKVSYKSNALTFAGYYTLTFEEQGWVIETTLRGDGRQHPLMHLTELTRK